VGNWEREEGKRYRLKKIKIGNTVQDKDQYDRVCDCLENHLHAKGVYVKEAYAIDAPHLVKYLFSLRSYIKVGTTISR